MKELRKDSIVRGHHIYKSVGTPVICEELYLEAEQSSEHDEYAVAIRKDAETVGHVPRSFSRVLWCTWRLMYPVYLGFNLTLGIYFLHLCLAAGVYLRPDIYLSPAF